MTTTTRKPAAAKPAAAAKTTARKPVAAKPAAKAAAKPAAKAPARAAAATTVAAAAPAAPVYNFTKPYKMLTGLDTPDFCDKVSAHLNAGYTLVGGAAITAVGGKVYVAQAVTKHSNITKPKSKGKKKK